MAKLMIICAESSGDFLVAELIDSLKLQFSDIQFTHSLVGEECKKRGIHSVMPLSLIAKMGFVEILSLIPMILKLRSEIIKTIEIQKPDCVICVDGFALTHFIAKKIKKKYPQIKLVKYIAPKLWAWASWRAYRLKIYDLVLVCLPFEVDFFQEKHIPVEFVGHSALERIKKIDNLAKQKFKNDYKIPQNKKNILLLLGSRDSEIQQLQSIFWQVAKKFDVKSHHFIIPVADNKQEYFKNIPFEHTLIFDSKHRFKAFQIADVALAASGTVSLELMICKVPTVIAYKVSWLTGKIAHFLVKIPYVTLLNIMFNKEIFPEFLQENCCINALYQAVYQSLYDDKIIQFQKEYCQKGIDMLSVYDENMHKKIPPSSVAAKKIYNLLENSK
jgi:lipid-A-disaccharide synthase